MATELSQERALVADEVAEAAGRLRERAVCPTASYPTWGEVHGNDPRQTMLCRHSCPKCIKEGRRPIWDHVRVRADQCLIDSELCNPHHGGREYLWAVKP